MTDQETNGKKEYLLVTEYFHPDAASTGQLMTDLAVGLQNRGLNMTVLTGQPNYHSGENTKQPYQEYHEGVLVKRVRAPQFRQSTLLRRLVDWILFTVWVSIALLVSKTEHNREVIFVTNPPILPLFLSIVCSLCGWEYTYIVYDLYPDFGVELGYISQDGLIHRVWEKLNYYAFTEAKHIVALGPRMKEKIIEKGQTDIDESKMKIIHNWEDPEFIQQIPKEDNWFSREHSLVEPFTLLYSGNIGNHHDLESVVRAAAQLDNGGQALIIGEGDERDRIVALAERLGVRGERVQFLPYQPLETLPYSLTAGDVSIVSVNNAVEGLCLSSKLYTSMAAGQPILLIASQSSDEARLVEKFQAGITVAPGEIDEILDAVEQWRSNAALVERHGTNAREAFEEHFTKERSIDRYYRMLTGEAGQELPKYRLRSN